MFTYDAVQLYDLGYGPRLIPVTPPGGPIAPGSMLLAKNMGKAPGHLTPNGWTGIDLNNPRFRCHDYKTAKLWRDDWGSNLGMVLGDGYLVIDDDQGKEFSEILRKLLRRPLRRFVNAPKHDRDAFIVRVVDFVGDPVTLANGKLTFRNGVMTTEVSLLAHAKQFVIAGVHPGTRCPYVWEQELKGLDDVPLITVEELHETIKNFVEGVRKLGWNSSPHQGVSASVSAPTGGVKAPAANNIDPQALRDKIEQARDLLSEIPNRDVPAGEQPNDIDRWLDDYDNKIKVGYALAAFLGLYARTPEAEDLWIEWGEGRSQRVAGAVQAAWKSILNQPLRYGEMGLYNIVREFVAPYCEFPDVEPDMVAPKTSKTPIWDKLHKRWAYCRSQGFVDMQTGEVIDKQAFSDAHAYLARALAQELRLGKRRGSSVAGMFLTRPDRTEVFTVAYSPGDPELYPSKDPMRSVFNPWKATAMRPENINESEIALWLDHLLFVLDTKEERARFLRWCAFVAQNPRLKPHWHYLIMSLQGLGKDTLMHPIKLAVGEGNWHETLIYDLTTTFNYCVEHKLLIVGETAQPRAGFVTSHDYGNKLKPLLAAPPTHIHINKKYRTPYEIPNRLAVILFSNDENPLHLERGQRRVHVVNSMGKKSRNLDYYWRLHEWLNNGGAEKCAAYVLAYPLSESEKQEFVGPAPETDAKSELENLNIPAGLAALEEVLEDARAGVAGPVNLVATAADLLDVIRDKLKYPPTPRDIRAWLMGMEKQGKGVRRRRIDPKNPNDCGVVKSKDGLGRLWLLGEHAPVTGSWKGEDWSALTDAEVVSLWKNTPRPPSASVRAHPNAKNATAQQFPDDQI